MHSHTQHTLVIHCSSVASGNPLLALRMLNHAVAVLIVIAGEMLSLCLRLCSITQLKYCVHMQLSSILKGRCHGPGKNWARTKISNKIGGIIGLMLEIFVRIW